MGNALFLTIEDLVREQRNKESANLDCFFFIFRTGGRTIEGPKNFSQ